MAAPIQVAAMPIPFSETYLQQLTELVHDCDVLTQGGYVVEPLKLSEVERKRRCARCFRSLFKHQGKGKEKFKNKNKKHQLLKDTVDAAKAAMKNGASSDPTSLDPAIASLNSLLVPSQPAVLTLTPPPPPKTPKKEGAKACRFHDGQIVRGNWTCCNGHSQFSRPCQAAEHHQPSDHSIQWLLAQWHYYPTPTLSPWRLSQQRHAVTLDCEFGVSATGDSELISLAVVDYFSGQVLINQLVFPKVRMLHYNTPFSGVRYSDLELAKRTGTCFRGRDEARNALYSYVGPETIIIGHALHQDLSSMRLIHKKVIDTLILEQNIAETCRIDTVKVGRVDEEPGNEDGGATLDGTKPEKKPEQRRSGSLTLKALARDRLGREIQIGSHDALEDTIATRDLCHWYMVNVVGKMQPVGSIEAKVKAKGRQPQLEDPPLHDEPSALVGNSDV